MLSMLLCLLLVACEPAQTKFDALATQIVANLTSTQTVIAPTSTSTPANTPTSTPAPMNTPTNTPTVSTPTVMATATATSIPTATSSPLVTAGEPSPLPPELSARIPDLEIPDELLMPEIGNKNFNEFTWVLGQRGDWFLVSTFDSIYPIPAGWTNLSTGKEDAIVVFSKGGIQTSSASEESRFDKVPEIAMTIGGSGGQYQTSEEIIALLEDTINQAPNLSLIKQQVIDSNKAYIFLKAKPESGSEVYRLIVIARPPADEWFRTISVITEVEDWDDYYPIIRAIVENWALSWDNSTLGIALPETLVD